ncbi:conserved exported protein of unknown function [Candidatus Filomicrobium marinum]|uniref:Lipoprotein n=1 Tax=Candidatus Filomicrobium marinum TaxID=1608628 RepID=A0A0D6JIC8_9HYPH|nr:hypothetical protein [Candidatus Filomicrobium marinum]CFX36342.1 conserved exported protein of unknown function [Candidatus Filomicrobium marinum]CPR21752.1 conserved exported protein of unknown function [Candidatus Filomicrobium marinum]
MWRGFALALFLLGGCSTPYQEMGFAGGVGAQQMTSDTFRISARGNGYTGRTQVQDYLMLKAAETTTQHGGTHFIVIDAADASGTSQIVTGGTATTTYNHNVATTNYTPPMVHNVFKPGQDAYIRILNIGPGQPVPGGAVSASEIIQFVGSRVKRG